MPISRRQTLALGVRSFTAFACPAGFFSMIGQACAAKTMAAPLDILVKTKPLQPIAGLGITTTDGGQVDLGQFRGRFIVLNLWASWCFPCRDEMPSLSRLASQVSRLAISVLPLAVERRGAEAVAEFYQTTSISNLPTLLGDGQNIADVLHAWGLPFTVLIDAEGREFGRVTGPARWDDPRFVEWLTAQVGA